MKIDLATRQIDKVIIRDKSGKIIMKFEPLMVGSEKFRDKTLHLMFTCPDLSEKNFEKREGNSITEYVDGIIIFFVNIFISAPNINWENKL